MSMKIHGLDELNAQLKELGDEVTQQRKMRIAARKAFAPVLASARAKAPVATGVLRDSITIATALPKEGESVVAVGLQIGGQASWRWHFSEMGTVHQAAHPFLRPALDENADAVVANVQTELRKSIERAIKNKKKGKK